MSKVSSYLLGKWQTMMNRPTPQLFKIKVGHFGYYIHRQLGMHEVGGEKFGILTVQFMLIALSEHAIILYVPQSYSLAMLFWLKGFCLTMFKKNRFSYL